MRRRVKILSGLRRSEATERRSRKDPGAASCNHSVTGSSTETTCTNTFAVREGFHYKFWAYILVSRTGALYVGITGYFDRRIQQHKNGFH